FKTSMIAGFLRTSSQFTVISAAGFPAVSTCAPASFCAAGFAGVAFAWGLSSEQPTPSKAIPSAHTGRNWRIDENELMEMKGTLTTLALPALPAMQIQWRL